MSHAVPTLTALMIRAPVSLRIAAQALGILVAVELKIVRPDLTADSLDRVLAGVDCQRDGLDAPLRPAGQGCGLMRRNIPGASFEEDKTGIIRARLDCSFQGALVGRSRRF